MKKFLSSLILISLFATTLFTPASADVIANNDNVIAFNDFENTGAFSKSGFTITDSGDSSHGKVFVIPASLSSAIPTPNIYSVSYTYNNKTFNVFHEAITTGEDYIVMYDYWCDPNPTGTFNTSIPFGFAPSHEQLFISGDHRHSPQYFSDGLWHSDKLSFTAGVGDISTSTTAEGYINMKPHTRASNIKTYIDNYLVVKAGEIVFNDSTESAKLEIISDNIITSDSVGAYNKKTTFPLGSELKFKINAPNGVMITVANGNTVVSPDADGVYSFVATDDVEISVETDTTLIENEFTIIDDSIYVDYGTTPIKFAEALGVTAKFFNFKRGSASVPNDVYLHSGDKICYSGQDVEPYGVNIIGDIADVGDGKVNVSDIVALVDFAFGKSTDNLPSIMYDFNNSGKVTVSDVVMLRKKIMNAQLYNNVADSNVVNKMNSFVDDILTRSKTGATRTDIDNSIYSNYNRARIAEVINKAMNGEDITIVYFGGSITEGAGGSSAASFTHNITETGGYISWVTRWFKTFFPDINVTAYNSGIGSTDTPQAIHRMVEDVLAHKPDLVINEWACNDAARYPYKVGTYEAVLRRLYEHDIAVILYGFATRDGAGSQELHKPVAEFYSTPFVSYYDAYKNNSKWTDLTNDGTHPNIVGHALAGATFANFFQKVYEDIDVISSDKADIPKEYFHDEACYYEGAYLANFKDIYQGKIDGVKIKSLGDFTISSSAYKKGCRTYYPCTANYSSSGTYDPMVIEIDSCKTLFVLARLITTGNNPNGSYYVKINDKTVGNFTTSDGHGDYTWATSRLMYDATSPKATVEIYPNISAAGGHVDLLALLIS